MSRVFRIATFFTLIRVFESQTAFPNELVDCSQLLHGQYWCNSPVVNPKTQQPDNCALDASVTVTCVVRAGLDCVGLDNTSDTFVKRIENACTYSESSNKITALLLSVFLGVFGIDRFYLGHINLGLLKLFSCGFFFLLYVADIVFIALEVIGPADGSSYYTNVFSPRIFASVFTNETTILLFDCVGCA